MTLKPRRSAKRVETLKPLRSKKIRILVKVMFIGYFFRRTCPTWQVIQACLLQYFLYSWRIAWLSKALVLGKRSFSQRSNMLLCSGGVARILALQSAKASLPREWAKAYCIGTMVLIHKLAICAGVMRLLLSLLSLPKEKWFFQ